MTRLQLVLFDATLGAVALLLLAFMVCRCNAQCPGGMCPTQPQYGYQSPQTAPQQRYGPQFIPQNQGLAKPEYYSAVCRVSSVMADGSQGLGSGVLVDMQGRYKEGIVITAAHVVPKGTRGISVRFPAAGDVAYQATIWKRDVKNDIAALIIPRPNIPAIRIADRADKGETCTLAGWGGTPRKGFFAHRATLLEIGNSQLKVSSTSSQGDSGGLIINRRGRIVGVISATSDPRAQYGYTIGASYGPLRLLLGLPPRWEYREEYRRRNAPPPQYQQQAPQGQSPQNMRPILPDTSNLVTKAEYERDKAMVMEEVGKVTEGFAFLRGEYDKLTAEQKQWVYDRLEELNAGAAQQAVEFDKTITADIARAKEEALAKAKEAEAAAEAAAHVAAAAGSTADRAGKEAEVAGDRAEYAIKDAAVAKLTALDAQEDATKAKETATKNNTALAGIEKGALTAAQIAANGVVPGLGGLLIGLLGTMVYRKFDKDKDGAIADDLIASIAPGLAEKAGKSETLARLMPLIKTVAGRTKLAGLLS